MLNKKNPHLSICCITYNHAAYIRQCLEGFVMQQTSFSFEVLIHDDASTDGTEEIVKEFERKYPHIIKPLYEKENQWVKGRRGSKVFNFPRAVGKYIAMCEGDDYWTDPLKLQKQVDFLEKNEEYGMVHTNFDTYYQNANFFLRNTHSVYNIDIKDNCALNYWDLFGKAMATIKTPTVCVRHDLIKKWQSVIPENNWLIGDFPMYFYISLHSKIGYINESTSVYRTVPDGSASNVGKDNKKKLYLRKSYVDIRLHFFVKYKLDEKKFRKALIGDFNLLFDYCVLTANDSILSEYLDKLTNLKLQEEVNILSKVYAKSNNSTQKLILQHISKLKLFISTYIFKLFDRKILLATLQRKLS